MCYMRFNDHSLPEGAHATFSASKGSWLNYDEQKFEAFFVSMQAARRGTRLHKYAAEAIALGIHQSPTEATLNRYINDAIGYRMTPEQPLVYSPLFFGTPDAIGMRELKLRIHDLKTGIVQTGERQLKIYAALFCLEYGYKPHELDIELRIYQNDDIRIYLPTDEEIEFVMDKIKALDKRYMEMLEEDQ